MRAGQQRLLRISALLTLLALAFMGWSVLVPRPVPLVLFMTLGQVIGTASLALFVVAILIDLRRARVIGPTGGRETAPPPKGPSAIP
jgi:hypothetical protein